MAVAVDIKVPRNQFPQLSQQIRGLVSDVIADGMLSFVAQADPITPADTGTMRADKSFDWPSPDKLEGIVGYGRWYSIYVHEGTYRMAPRPWARQAMDLIGPDYIAALQSVVPQAVQ